MSVYMLLLFFFFFFFFFFLPSKQLFEFHYNGLLTVKMKWIRPNEITLTSICINTPKLLKVWLLLKERIFSQGKRVFSFKNTLFWEYFQVSGKPRDLSLKWDETVRLVKASFLFEVNGYTWQIYDKFCIGDKFLWLPVCFPARQFPSEKGPIIKGKTLLLRGANSFL